MWQTLFVIPSSIAGIHLFGVGWLLAVWTVIATVLLLRSVRLHGFGPETTGQLPLLIVAALTIVYILPALVDPAAGGVPIRGYGVLLLASVLSGIMLSVSRARKIGIDPEIILSLATWFFISGLIGARLFYVVEYWPNFRKPSIGETLVAIVNLTQGGLVVYGSMLAGGAALVVFIRKHHLPGLAFADLIAPGVVLGVGMGRIGCFLNGCCYGGISDVPWAVSFPAGSPAYIDQAQRGELYVHGLVFRGTGDEPPIIAAVEPGSPAEQAGVKPRQHVVAIAGRQVATVDEAQRALFATFGAGKPMSVEVAGDPQPKSWTIAAPLPTSRPVHPTQLYSFFDALLLCRVYAGVRTL